MGKIQLKQSYDQKLNFKKILKLNHKVTLAFNIGDWSINPANHRKTILAHPFV